MAFKFICFLFLSFQLNFPLFNQRAFADEQSAKSESFSWPREKTFKNLGSGEIYDWNNFSRESKEKKGVVFTFLSMKCPCSVGHLVHLKELSGKFPEFAFIGVNSNSNEDENDAGKFFQNQNLPFPVLRDNQFFLADHLGALKTPDVFVLDQQGKVKFQGGITDSQGFKGPKKFYLQEALESIRQGKNPEDPRVMTLGCYISRKKP